MAKKTAKKSQNNSQKKSKSKPNAKVKSKSASAPKKSASKVKAKSASNSKLNSKSVAPKTASKKATAPVVKMTAVSASAPRAKGSSKVPRFNPLDDRIVIERVEAPEKTAGGLFIPDSAQEKPTVGKVVAVGRGHRDAKGRTRPCDVKVGDRVLFTAWSGSEIEVDGSKYVILRETDLLGVTTA